jgi:hypothetical protein
MLASLLYPYDDDAPKLMEGWLTELEKEGCIRRYRIGTDTYLESCNWLKHQRIDKPSPSRLPAFEEASRIVAKPREGSSPDLVSSILDQDLGTFSLRSNVAQSSKQKSKRSLPEQFPLQEDLDWANQHWLKKGRTDLCGGINDEAEKFRDYHTGKNDTSADWSASWRTWTRNAMNFSKANGHGNGTIEHRRTSTDQHLAAIASLIGEGRERRDG